MRSRLKGAFKMVPVLGLLGGTCSWLALAETAMAWRETGHFVVCQIAWDHLTPAAKSKLSAVVGNKPFATQCTWPDMVRKSPKWEHTYDWHFINLDDGEAYFSTPLNPAGDVVQAMTKAEEVLKSESASTDEKLFFARFMGHFAGDIHQPLHIGRKVDLGGNLIDVRWYGATSFDSAEILQAALPGQPCPAGAFIHEPTGECVKKHSKADKIKLHKVWDLQLLEQFIKTENLPRDEDQGLVPPGDQTNYHYQAYARKIDQGHSREQVARWQTAYFYQWAKESLDIGEEAELQYRAIPADQRTRTLDADYFNATIGVVNKRLVQGGYRLAAFFNRVLDPGSQPVLRNRFLDLAWLELRARLDWLMSPVPAPN